MVLCLESASAIRLLPGELDHFILLQFTTCESDPSVQRYSMNNGFDPHNLHGFRYVLESEHVKKFFDYIQLPNFDIAADAAATFKVLTS